MLNGMYDNLKSYIDIKINGLQTSLKQLFDDYSVKAVGDNIDGVKFVNDNIDKIDSLNDISSDITTVADNKDSVINVSNNLDSVRNYSSTYLGSSDTVPTTRKDGSELLNGDMYFNSVENRAKIYSVEQGIWADIGNTVKGIKKDVTFEGDGDTKEFSVDNGFDANNGLVFLNGSNVTADVDISDGSNVKFNDAPDDGDDILCIFFGSFELTDVYLKVEANVITNNNIVSITDDYTAKNGDRIYADTSNGSFTVTLPDTIEAGFKVIVKDVKSSFNDNNLTIDRNGNTLNNSDDNIDLDENDKTYIIEAVNDSNWEVS